VVNVLLVVVTTTYGKFDDKRRFAKTLNLLLDTEPLESADVQTIEQGSEVTVAWL
jgi:hypothetical protein